MNEDIDLSSLDRRELLLLLGKIDLEIRKRVSSRTGRIGRGPKKTARKHMPGESAARIFVNPGNCNEVWHGSGRRPAWITHYLSKGGSLEDIATPARRKRTRKD